MNGEGIQSGNNNNAAGSGTSLTGGIKKYFVSSIGDITINHGAGQQPDSIEFLEIGRAHV